MQSLRSCCTLVKLLCALQFLPEELLHRNDFDLRVMVRQASHVPVLVLDLVDLADDCVGGLGIIREPQVYQVTGVVLVKRYLIQNDKLCANIL